MCGSPRLNSELEIGGFGRDLDGHASGFTHIEPRNENRSIVILCPIFWGLGMPQKNFPLPPKLSSLSPNLVPLSIDTC